MNVVHPYLKYNNLININVNVNFIFRETNSHQYIVFFIYFKNVSKTLFVFLSVHCLQGAYQLQNAITQLTITSRYWKWKVNLNLLELSVLITGLSELFRISFRQLLSSSNYAIFWSVSQVQVPISNAKMRHFIMIEYACGYVCVARPV